METITLDAVDLRLIHALTIDGRAPFNRLAAVLDVSDQTVARRYRRLRRAGAIRVIGQLDARHLGHVDWALRLHVAPGAAATIARSLARRPDTSWVQLASGGTEVLCGTRASNQHDHDALLSKLTDTRPILAISAQCILHSYCGGPAAWSRLTRALTPTQEQQLRCPVTSDHVPIEFTDADRALLDALGTDGRASHAALAQTTGWHESTVRRRIETLRAAEALFFDVDVDERLLGVQASTILWMSVVPAQLSTVGHTLADHQQVAFTGATTGETNLFASVMCRDVYALYDYLTTEIADLTAITRVETVPIASTIKRGGMHARHLNASLSNRVGFTRIDGSRRHPHRGP